MAPKKSTIVLNVEQFIRDVEERPAIWNRNFHCNKAFLEQMWDELSAAHKLPKVVLKAKWKGLRDNFRVEYKRIPRAENGEFLVEPATFESKWIHYYALLFLTDHMRHRLPKNEQDQSFFFAQQSQDCEKTVVEPDLTNGLIRRMQDSDEDYDEDEMVDDDDELSNLQAASQTNTNNSSTTTALTTTNNIPKSAEATSAAAAAAVAAAFMDSHHTPASAVALTTFTSALQPPLLSTRTRTPPAAHTNSLPTTTTTAAVAAATAAASTFFKSEESRAASLMSSVAANSFLFNAAAVAAAAAAASSSAELDSEVQDLSIKAKYVPSSQQLLTSNNNSLCAKNYNNQSGSNSAKGLLFPFNSRSSVGGSTNMASRRNVERSLSSSCSSPSSSSSPPPSLPPPSSLSLAPPATTATLPLSLTYGGMPSIAGLSCTPTASNGGMNGVSSSTATPSTPPRNASRLSASALQLLPTTSSASVSPHISSKQHQLYHHVNGGAIDGGGGRSAFGDLCSAADALLSDSPTNLTIEALAAHTTNAANAYAAVAPPKAHSHTKRSVSPPPLYNKAHHPLASGAITVTAAHGGAGGGGLHSKERDDYTLNGAATSLEQLSRDYSQHCNGGGLLLPALKLKRARFSEDSSFNGANSPTPDGARSLTPVPEDDDYHYLLSLHPYMKQLTASQKLRIRTRIQKLIFKDLYKEDLDESLCK